MRPLHAGSCRPIRIVLAAVYLLICTGYAYAQPLTVGVVGLNHDHVHNIMHQFRKDEVIIAGIAEADEQLVNRYKKSYQLPDWGITCTYKFICAVGATSL